MLQKRMLHDRKNWDLVCVFACLGFYITTRNFSLLWRHHYNRWLASDFILFSALIAIEPWVFFSVSDLLWHGESVYNGHYWYPWQSLLLPSFGSDAVKPYLKNYVCRNVGSGPYLLYARQTIYNLNHCGDYLTKS